MCTWSEAWDSARALVRPNNKVGPRTLALCVLLWFIIIAPAAWYFAR